MKHFRMILLSFLSVVVLMQCKRGGPGGKATVETSVKHHSKTIPSATVYVKYGAVEFPGDEPGIYDDFKVTDNSGRAYFTGLLKGNYFFYGVGFDSTIHQTVSGGLPLGITKAQKDDKIPLLVPVTE